MLVDLVRQPSAAPYVDLLHAAAALPDDVQELVEGRRHRALLEVGIEDHHELVMTQRKTHLLRTRRSRALRDRRVDVRRTGRCADCGAPGAAPGYPKADAAPAPEAAMTRDDRPGPVAGGAVEVVRARSSGRRGQRWIARRWMTRERTSAAVTTDSSATATIAGRPSPAVRGALPVGAPAAGSLLVARCGSWSAPRSVLPSTAGGWPTPAQLCGTCAATTAGCLAGAACRPVLDPMPPAGVPPAAGVPPVPGC